MNYSATLGSVYIVQSCCGPMPMWANLAKRVLACGFLSFAYRHVILSIILKAPPPGASTFLPQDRIESPLENYRMAAVRAPALYQGNSYTTQLITETHN